MNDQWWSWILTVVGLTGFWLAGRKVWWCWYINLGCQALWFAYAFATEQYGFVAAAAVYSFVFGQNAVRWTKEHKAKPRVIYEGELDWITDNCLIDKHKVCPGNHGYPTNRRCTCSCHWRTKELVEDMEKGW